MPDRRKKTRVCHVNLLKHFYASKDFNNFMSGSEEGLNGLGITYFKFYRWGGG